MGGSEKYAVKWLVTIAIGFAVMAGQIGESAAETVTLEEVLDQVPQRHETWEITEMQIRRSQAMRRDALARLLPHLNLSANITRQGGEEVEVGDQTVSRRLDWGVGGVASIAIFDGPAFFDYWRMGALVDATEYSAQWQRRVLMLETELAFYTLASAQRSVEIAEAAVEWRRDYLERAEALVDAGLAVRVDASRARADVLEAEQALLEAEATVGDAADSLATLMGQPPDGQLRAEFDPETIDVAFPDEMGSVSEERDDFAAQVYQIEATELGHRAIWWSLAPRIEFRVQTNWGPTTLFNPDRFNWSMILAATWNLYDGGGRYARADAAQAEVREQELALERDLRDADVELARALRQWRTAAAAVEVAAERLELAQEIYEQELMKFEAGLVTSLEVSDASQELLNAELGLNQQRLQARLAEVQYRYLAVE